jgi:hypothetical protein
VTPQAKRDLLNRITTTAYLHSGDTVTLKRQDYRDMMEQLRAEDTTPAETCASLAEWVGSVWIGGEQSNRRRKLVAAILRRLHDWIENAPSSKHPLGLEDTVRAILSGETP